MTSFKYNAVKIRRVIAMSLLITMLLLFAPVTAEASSSYSMVTIAVEGVTHSINLRLIDETVYCRADQWAKIASCLYEFNVEQNILYFYYDTPLILCKYDSREYIEESGCFWVPLFKTADETGVFFSGIENEIIQGYRAKTLAEFYAAADRTLGVSRYRITALIQTLGTSWTAISVVSRAYEFLKSGIINGVVNSVSGKTEQEVYDDIFLKLLETDESLLGAVTGFGKDLTRAGKVFHTLQKLLDDGGDALKWLKKMGFSDNEIWTLRWKVADVAYGEKLFNDLADIYEIEKTTNLLKLLGLIDEMTASVEADVHTILGIQELAKFSDNLRITQAAEKAVGKRTDNTLTAIGSWSLEVVTSYLTDKVSSEMNELFEAYYDIDSIQKLASKALVWVGDKALSLSDKAKAVAYADVYSLIQMDLMRCYYQHRDDDSADNGLRMHSIVLTYLRACRNAWNMFAFDDSISTSVKNATTTIEAEIAVLMSFTEEELLQNGTSDDCRKAIIDLLAADLKNYPNCVELFDHTYWEMYYGESLGFQFTALFYPDGSFHAYSHGSGMLEFGMYTYDETTGRLSVYLLSWGDEFTYQNGAFISRDLYEMQAGEAHLTITPSQMSREKLEELFTTAPENPYPSTEDSQPWELTGTWNAYTRSDSGEDTAWYLNLWEDGHAVVARGEPNGEFTEYMTFSWSAEAWGNGEYYLYLDDEETADGRKLACQKLGAEIWLENEYGFGENSLAQSWYERDLTYETWLERLNHYGTAANQVKCRYAMADTGFTGGDTMDVTLWSPLLSAEEWRRCGEDTQVIHFQAVWRDWLSYFLMGDLFQPVWSVEDGKTVFRGDLGGNAKFTIDESGKTLDGDQEFIGLQYGVSRNVKIAEDCVLLDSRNTAVPGEIGWQTLFDYFAEKPLAADGVTEYPLAYVTLTFTAREDGIYITEIEIPYFQ